MEYTTAFLVAWILLLSSFSDVGSNRLLRGLRSSFWRVVCLDEKERMVVLSFIVFLFFGLASVVDGAFTVKTYWDTYNQDWSGIRYWVYALMILVSAGSFLCGVASILADNHALSTEDMLGALLLFIQPWVLWWGGLLDLISRTTQAYFWHETSLLSYLGNAFDWTWLDPPATSNIPMLPYLISRLFGYAYTQHIGVILGSLIAIIVVAVFWWIYYEYA